MGHGILCQVLDVSPSPSGLMKYDRVDPIHDHLDRLSSNIVLFDDATESGFGVSADPWSTGSPIRLAWSLSLVSVVSVEAGGIGKQEGASECEATLSISSKAFLAPS